METSAPARALIAVTAIVSTVTSVSFFSPHSLTYLSMNHLSKAGTKWLHRQILRVLEALFWPRARRGANSPPRAAAPTPTAWMNFRLENFLALAMVPSLPHVPKSCTGTRAVDRALRRFFAV